MIGTIHSQKYFETIFGVAQIIQQLSRVITLEPCDIIASGTPPGEATTMNPQRWLKAGDVVLIEIEDIGSLENTVEER